MEVQQALEVAKTLARMAAERILLYYGKEKDVSIKEDDSPVTVADKEANNIIVKGLKEAYPDHGILAEESVDDRSRLDKEYVWIVDPLDGTKEFISGRDDFTVNIALTQEGKVILGVIAVPAKNVMYWGSQDKAWKRVGNEPAEPIKVSDEKDPGKMLMATSRSHSKPEEDELFKNAGFKELMKSGSSVKGCLIAEGKAHVYPRFGNTHEWDVAAMAAIVENAGGTITDIDGKPLCWNKEETLLNGFIISNGTIHDDIVKWGEKNE